MRARARMLQALWDELEVPDAEVAESSLRARDSFSRREGKLSPSPLRPLKVAEFLWNATATLPPSSACLRLYQQEEQRLQEAA